MLRLHPRDPRFPPRLLDVDPPDLLVVDGPLAEHLGRMQAVAIVGTRAPSPDALRFTRTLAAQLAEAGYVVVSGGARGIDTAAHEGALAGGGRTVAVLPSAIDAWVPAANASLFRRIREGGALVALVERRQKPRFFARNAVIAGLADHVVVTAAPIESGARNTALHARKAGRTLWVVPGAPWDPTMAGCGIELTIGGAHALIAPEQLLRRLTGEPLRRRRSTPPSQGVLPLDPEAAAIVSALPGSVDELVERTRRPVGRVTATLTLLADEGRIRECEPGVYDVRR